MVSQGDVLPSGHPAHVLRHGECRGQSEGGGNHRSKGHKIGSVYGKLPFPKRTLQTQRRAVVQGNSLTPHVPARRTIERTVSPLGTARTRLAGVCRSCFPRTAI